ncbi:MAG: hypothetical protein FJ278_24385, partial [Planctomycetes bacterium]|nr:hypothetical protein [Planctomycetota bacterium]
MALLLNALADVCALAAEDSLVNIAPLARVSCEPAAERESAARATDGNPGSGLVFAVGSQGEGSVTLTFDAPRRIQKIRVLQGQPAYHSTAYRLLADKDGDGAFETTLADAKDSTPWGEWAEFTFALVEVRAVRFQSVAGKSEGRRAHPVVNELAVYGLATAQVIQEMMRMGTR